jgi:general stress protein 26
MYNPRPRNPDSVKQVLEQSFVKALLPRRLIARLGLQNGDGTIHLTAVWFLFEDGKFLVPTYSSSKKIRNIQRDNRATILVDRASPGFDVQGVMVVGRASIVRGREAIQMNRRVHLKYLAPSALDEPVLKASLRDDVTISVNPEWAASWDHTQRDVARLIRERGLFWPLD